MASDSVAKLREDTAALAALVVAAVGANELTADVEARFGLTEDESAETDGNGEGDGEG